MECLFYYTALEYFKSQLSLSLGRMIKIELQSKKKCILIIFTIKFGVLETLQQGEDLYYYLSGPTIYF